MINTKIKDFDTAVGNLLNQGIADIGISTVILVLDKYMKEALNIEREVLNDEFNEEQIKLKRIADEKKDIENALIKEAENFESKLPKLEEDETSNNDIESTTNE